MALWLALTIVLWNAVYDRVLVRAGRQYAHEAALQFDATGRPLLIDHVMRPAAARALQLASASAGGVLLVGGLVLWRGARRERETGSCRGRDAAEGVRRARRVRP